MANESDDLQWIKNYLKEKDINKLEDQIENFEHANDLIKLFLDIKG